MAELTRDSTGNRRIACEASTAVSAGTTAKVRGSKTVSAIARQETPGPANYSDAKFIDLLITPRRSLEIAHAMTGGGSYAVE